uniref:Uncharacterized protein n=1 Tax=viral metagenome TaxID=1070528 RepID=A0A6C0I3L6_9ZZZZ
MTLVQNPVASIVANPAAPIVANPPAPIVTNPVVLPAGAIPEAQELVKNIDILIRDVKKQKSKQMVNCFQE